MCGSTDAGGLRAAERGRREVHAAGEFHPIVTNREVEVRERPMTLHVEVALRLSGALLGRVLSRQKSAVVQMQSTMRS
jgi:hypothetical protein